MQTHIWRMRLLEVQLRAAIECGNQWEAAVEAAQALLQFYRWLYPKVCIVVLQYDSIVL